MNTNYLNGRYEAAQMAEHLNLAFYLAGYGNEDHARYHHAKAIAHLHKAAEECGYRLELAEPMKEAAE